MIYKRSEAELVLLRTAGSIAADVLKAAGKYVRAGLTTLELDTFIESEILRRQAKPAFKGYRGYRHASCLSINEEIVHGIPSNKVIREGDIIAIDVGTIFKGYYGDVAQTFYVGNEPSKAIKKLLKIGFECLEKGIKQARCGNHVGDISFAIESHASKNGYSVVRDLFGHGVGKNLHEDPLIPNFGKPGTGPRLEKGMVFAIEPMVNAGVGDIVTLDDGWTVITKDKMLSVHFERTIAITDGDPEIISKAG